MGPTDKPQEPSAGRRPAGAGAPPDEHDSFLQSVALVDWLVLLLVVLYLLVSHEPLPSPAITGVAVGAFAAFLLAIRSRHFPVRSPVRRIALDVFVTVAFLTAIVTQAGVADSPLANLFLLPLVVSAVTLRARVTVLVFAVVSLALVWLHLVGEAGAGVQYCRYSRPWR